MRAEITVPVACAGDEVKAALVALTEAAGGTTAREGEGAWCSGDDHVSEHVITFEYVVRRHDQLAFKLALDALVRAMWAAGEAVVYYRLGTTAVFASEAMTEYVDDDDVLVLPEGYRASGAGDTVVPGLHGANV